MLNLETEKKVKLNLDTYKDKVYACWIGKNIGGTMGTPYEGQRVINDIQGFVTKENEVLPNDDLDLQLVWLHAVEELGPQNVTPLTLGEMWVSFIGPYWNEYGLGKNNLKHGMIPPLSGDYRNNWRDSNGAWIRTEIWASLAPAAPDVALKYAFADASVDHGVGEGTIAAVFVAAIESAAYVINDFRKLLDIGLSKIPAESRVARSVRLLLKCYEEGDDWKTARNKILQENADIGDGWFEAPSNVAYTMLGILYGECDFKKSMIIAINCGDDTDCTGATVGSILGIMGGMAAIPEDWRKHLGDDIVTVSVNKGCLYGVPKTCTELTAHVVNEAPAMLHANRRDLKYYVEFTDGETEVPEDAEETFADPTVCRALLDTPPYSYEVNFNVAKAIVTFDKAPDIEPGESIRVKVRFVNQADIFGCMPYFLNLSWILPDDWTVEGPRSVQLPHVNAHNSGMVDTEFVITAGETTDPVNRLILEAVVDERPTTGLIPVTVYGC